MNKVLLFAVLFIAAAGFVSAVVPLANFTGTPLNGTAPLSVQFNDTSLNSPNVWEWDFNNDGLIDSILQNPSYVYGVPGQYTVNLTVGTSTILQSLGSATSDNNWNAIGSPDAMSAFVFVANATGTLSNVELYVTEKGSDFSAIGWLYNGTPGAGGTLVAGPFNYSIAGTPNFAVNSTYVGAPIVSGTTYWLVWWTDSGYARLGETNDGAQHMYHCAVANPASCGSWLGYASAVTTLNIQLYASNLTSSEVKTNYITVFGPAANSTWVSPTPDDGSITSTQVILNASCAPGNNTNMYFGNSFPLTEVLNDSVSGEYITSMSVDGRYYYQASCRDPSTGGVSALSSLRTIIYDSVAPVVSLTNITGSNSVFVEATVNETNLDHVVFGLYQNGILVEQHNFTPSLMTQSSLVNNLSAYWSYDDVIGNTLLDSQGIYNGTTRGVTYSAGKIGNAGNFNPYSLSEVVLQNDSFTTYQDITVCAWAKPLSQGSDRVVFHMYGNPGDYNQYKLGVNYNNNMFTNYLVCSLTSSDTCNAFSMSSGASSISFGTYYYVCEQINYGANNASLWVDGTMVASRDLNITEDPSALGGIQNLTHPTQVVMGKDPYYDIAGHPDWCGAGTVNGTKICDRWDGQIDEVSVYNRALSASEINASYQNGLAGKPLSEVKAQYVVSYNFTGLSGSYTVNVTAIDKGNLYAMQSVVASFASASNFTHKLGFTVGNATTPVSAQTDYQSKIVFNTKDAIANGSMQSNCADIRITNSSDGVLPYWIEEAPGGCNSTATVVWFKADYLAANTTTQFYLYYGNSSVISEASGDNTFLFFDDFNGASLNISKWETPYYSSLASQDSGYMKMDFALTQYQMQTVNNSFVVPYSCTFYGYQPYPYNSVLGVNQGYPGYNIYAGGIYSDAGYGSFAPNNIYGDVSGIYGVVSHLFMDGKPHTYTVGFSDITGPSSTQVYLDGELMTTGGTYGAPDSPSRCGVAVGYSTQNKMWSDYSFARKFLLNEPFVNVSLLPVASFPSTANFVANITSGDTLLSVQFTDMSTHSPVSWFWDFGDGTNSTAQNPIHVFAAGTYTVSLTATNSVGSDTGFVTNYIFVNTPIVYSTNITTSSCSGLVYPNEKDLPVPSIIQYNFTVSVSPAFNVTSYVTYIKHAGDAVIVPSCSFVGNSTVRIYSCNATMNYYKSSGLYSIYVNYTNDGLNATYQNVNICSYGQLLAMQKNNPIMTFAGAGPNVPNVQSSVPLFTENTGNVNFNVAMTGKDLTGRQNPGSQLPTSAFKAGIVLGSSYQLSNNVSVNVASLPASLNSNASIYLWLSMPTNTVPQDYYSQNPWQVSTS